MYIFCPLCFCAAVNVAVHCEMVWNNRLASSILIILFRQGKILALDDQCLFLGILFMHQVGTMISRWGGMY